mmetsp:Transcript_75003/g.160633  ORF Transcript_75003/g.160633 Transcript_75003/m.160633 type:complete len:273 (-) Transcript_75003:943-1761(-)
MLRRKGRLGRFRHLRTARRRRSTLSRRSWRKRGRNCACSRPRRKNGSRKSDASVRNSRPRCSAPPRHGRAPQPSSRCSSLRWSNNERRCVPLRRSGRQQHGCAPQKRNATARHRRRSSERLLSSACAWWPRQRRSRWNWSENNRSCKRFRACARSARQRRHVPRPKQRSSRRRCSRGRRSCRPWRQSGRRLPSSGLRKSSAGAMRVMPRWPVHYGSASAWPRRPRPSRRSWRRSNRSCRHCSACARSRKRRQLRQPQSASALRPHPGRNRLN